MADIGTDHALLPVALVQRNIVPRAIASDVREGPAQAARRQVLSAGLQSKIDVRVGDGLSVLKDGDSAATVVIAGMGGGTIAAILSEGSSALRNVRRLVLQPNNGERLVREWLLRHHWKLAAETLLEEDGVFYEVLAADRAAGKEEGERWNRSLYEPFPGFPGTASTLLALGPHLTREAGKTFVRKWQAHINKLDKLLASIARSSHPDAQRKYREMMEERNTIGEVLTWLSKSK